MSNSSRVMKNTLSLYIRMIILTVVSLFTVRINLNSLGAADYGLYNVVAGFITLFTFVSGSLTNASQRFFAIGIGKNDWNEVNKYFSVNLLIYIILSVILLLFAETVGLWFVLHKMVIAGDRIKAAVVVYQFSIINFIFGLFVSPFLALLVANEDLSIYSVVSIVEGGLKLLVSYLLYITTGDKLIVYGLLLLITAVLINTFYIIYTKTKYKQLQLAFIKDKSPYKEVFSFLNWNIIGAFASIFKGQGINVIINLFFGTVINAARGIAFQINTVVSSFSANFMKAIDPQIIKSYANGEKERFFDITCTASKIAFCLLFVIAMPLISNMEYVLTLWLKNVPDYTLIFAKLVLIDALIMSLTDPITTAVQAIGKIKWYQIVVGGMSLLNIPLSYILLRTMENPLVPFFVSIGISLSMMVLKIIFFKVLANISVIKYLLKVILPVFLITIIVVTFDFSAMRSAENFYELVINVVIEVSVIGILVVFVGFGKRERKVLFSTIPFIKKFVKD